MKKGYCNCKSDTWQTNRKTPYLQFVRDTYHEVRVDKHGLCFLCANTALCAPPPHRPDPRHVDHIKKEEGDLTVGPNNPDGIFLER